MIDIKICEWLLENADAPIRYRVVRELLKDEQAAKKIEPELFEHKEIQKWLTYLKPHDPPQHWNMEHGCFDFNLENAMSKCVHLGLHGGMPQMQDAVWLYLDRIKNANTVRPCRFQFNEVMSANFLSYAGIKDDDTLKFMLVSLDEMYAFAKQNIYDIYLSPEERAKLTGIPKNWQNHQHFIRPDLLKEYGFCYPLIYDIIGLYRLYDLKDNDIDMKINTVVNYFACDDYQTKICGGYGILVEGKYDSGNPKYHSMGWSVHFPGWFDIGEYMDANAPGMLYFADFIRRYPLVLKTKWFNNLTIYLEKYKTESGRYLFPKEWLPQKSGYALGGFHMSYGENRRNKNWLEIESTFYMQLLKQNI